MSADLISCLAHLSLAVLFWNELFRMVLSGGGQAVSPLRSLHAQETAVDIVPNQSCDGYDTLLLKVKFAEQLNAMCVFEKKYSPLTSGL
jgi:hypothetical protein